MKIISVLLLMLVTGLVSAHEKHISTLTLTEGMTAETLNITVSVHQPDYLACSKGGKDEFAQWVNAQVHLSDGGTSTSMRMDSLIWGHDIRAVFTASMGNADMLNVHCALFSTCFPNQKTIVVAKLGGQDFGRVLTPLKDTCVFQIGK